MKNKKLILSLSLAGGLFALILLFDLLSKHFIFQSLPESGDSMEVIPGFFNFLHVENSGAAWGMLAGRPIFLIIISLVILGVYLWFYAIRLKKHKGNTSIVLSISVGLIVGGCFGNLIDRIVFGYVRDFINLQFMEFPVFNVADISLTIGIILMIAYFIFIYSKEDKKQEMLMKDLADFRGNNEVANIIEIEMPKDDENSNGDKKDNEQKVDESASKSSEEITKGKDGSQTPQKTQEGNKNEG